MKNKNNKKNIYYYIYFIENNTINKNNYCLYIIISLIIKLFCKLSKKIHNKSKKYITSTFLIRIFFF